MIEPDPLAAHRPNVGVVLFNAEGQVWMGRRADTGGPFNWQFPQGGVDPDEVEAGAWEAAARRELWEETGVRSADLLAATEGWIAYDFGPEHAEKKIARGWRGQKQKWFALRFTGDEAEIDLAAHQPVEFDAWCWADLKDAPGLIVPFKRAAYEQVVAAFQRFAR